MAARKSDSFFIRQSVDCTTGFLESTIDLGSFVDALGSAILRVHAIQVQYLDTSSSLTAITATADTVGMAQWQLTTQAQTTIVAATDKALISSGSLYIGGPETSNGAWMMNDKVDQNLSVWTRGYLVATEQLYLGGIRNGNIQTGDVTCSIVMECSVEKLTKEAALALALSQS